MREKKYDSFSISLYIEHARKPFKSYFCVDVINNKVAHMRLTVYSFYQLCSVSSFLFSIQKRILEFLKLFLHMTLPCKAADENKSKNLVSESCHFVKTNEIWSHYSDWKMSRFLHCIWRTNHSAKCVTF